ncbi:MAG: nuclear transport factor 2 family protein [Acidobacteriota bacterium]|nr:nuclear transport factor 2 family protein [Acidobacteriota bacterium]
MKLMIILTLVVLTAGAIFSLGQAQVTKTEELIRGMEGKLNAALLKGDSASVDAILADDYIEINAQGLVTHKPEVMRIVRARASAPHAPSVGPEVTIDETNLRTYGDTAVLVGRITTRYQFMDYQTSPDTPQNAAPINTEQERFMKVYSKRNGQWQLVASTRTAIAKLKTHRPANS